MNINKVNVGERTYDIEYTEFDEIWKDRNDIGGVIYYLINNIKIRDDSDKSKRDLFRTLLHEIIHAVELEWNLTCFEGENNHKQLCILSHCLADVLIDNEIVDLNKI